jgi:hypothetical protein
MRLIMALATFCSVVTVNAQQAATANPHAAKTYFITQEETLRNPDGSRVTEDGNEVAWEIFQGQRADGAKLHMYVSKANLQNGNGTRTVLFPDRGLIISVSLNPANHNKMTHGSGIPWAVDPGTDYKTCGVGKFAVGKETIQGFETIHSRRVMDNGVFENWYAPALDCESVRTVLTSAGGISTKEPIMLSDKAPDDSYFAIRDDLKEVDPATFRLSLGDKSEHYPPGWVEKQQTEYEKEKAAREQRKGQ